MKIRTFIMIILLAGSFLQSCGKEKKEKITEETLKKITVQNANKKADDLLKELNDF